MFELNVVSETRVRHYSIALTDAAGWEAKLEEDRAVCWRENYADWHRVERTLARMKQEVSDLLDRGWTLQSSSR